MSKAFRLACIEIKKLFEFYSDIERVYNIIERQLVKDHKYLIKAQRVFTNKNLTQYIQKNALMNNRSCTF